ncbi:unnamed protein product [Amoebophrya sp. A25]|nr:unnamed protein product [Amoebophrya sp. A25]|eukprot:GSA25T00002011001.1
MEALSARLGLPLPNTTYGQRGNRIAPVLPRQGPGGITTSPRAAAAQAKQARDAARDRAAAKKAGASSAYSVATSDKHMRSPRQQRMAGLGTRGSNDDDNDIDRRRSPRIRVLDEAEQEHERKMASTMAGSYNVEDESSMIQKQHPSDRPVEFDNPCPCSCPCFSACIECVNACCDFYQKYIAGCKWCDCINTPVGRVLFVFFFVGLACFFGYIIVLFLSIFERGD